MSKKIQFTFDKLNEIARNHTLEALRDYEISDEVSQNLILETSFKGNNQIFELYIPGEMLEDAKVKRRDREN